MTEFMIPDEIKDAIKAINNKFRFKIIENIYQKGPLSYTELLNELKLRKGSLTYHLDALLEGGLLDNYPIDEIDSQYKSYYSLSKFGRDFLSALFSPFDYTIMKPVTTNMRYDVPHISKKDIFFNLNNFSSIVGMYKKDFPLKNIFINYSTKYKIESLKIKELEKMNTYGKLLESKQEYKRSVL